MQTFFPRLLAASAMLTGTVVMADSPPAGATSCTGCHAADTISLDALSADEIVQAMADFRSGARDSTLMQRIAAGFTTGEAEAIAAWLTRE